MTYMHVFDFTQYARLHIWQETYYLTADRLSSLSAAAKRQNVNCCSQSEGIYTPNFKRPARTFCPNAYAVMLAHSPWRAWLQIYFLDIVIIHLQSVTKGVPILVCCQVCFSRYISTAFCGLLSFGTYLRHNRDVNLTWPWPSSTYRINDTNTNDLD